VDSKQGSGSRFSIRFPASRTVPVENLIPDRS
jgi:hypothetical protein